MNKSFVCIAYSEAITEILHFYLAQVEFQPFHLGGNKEFYVSKLQEGLLVLSIKFQIKT